MFWLFIIFLVLLCTGQVPNVGKTLGETVRGFKQGLKGENPNEREAQIVYEENDTPPKK